MNYRHQFPDVCSTSSTQNATHGDNDSTEDDDDPMNSTWGCFPMAFARIHDLSTILPDSKEQMAIAFMAETDQPASSLLSTPTAYTAVSSFLTTSSSSGTRDDPLCHWLYRAFRCSDPDFRLFVLTLIPLIAGIYLSHVHSPSSPELPLAGFEAVLLAIYSSESQWRAGNPIAISIPDLSQPSLYHSPKEKSQSQRSQTMIGVLCPPLEPQTAIKSTKRATIIGVALDCYYQQISRIPNWSILDFCKFVADWAGQDCACKYDFDPKPSSCEIEIEETVNVVEKLKKLEINHGESSNGGVRRTRIPLPWELLQPLLRILGHCLLGCLKENDVKDAATMAVRCLYARCYHDLVPQGILATRSLIQLDKRAREAASMAAAVAIANTPRKAKKPEILLRSK